MSASAISGSGNVNALSQLAQTRGSGRVDSDGDNDGDRGGRAGGVRRERGGGLVAALANALAQIGVTGESSTGSSTAEASSNTSATATSSVKDAFRAFAQDLFSALQGQGGPTNSSPTQGTPPSGRDSDGDNDGTGAAGGAGRHGYGAGGPGAIQSRLAALISQLSGSDTGTTDSTASDASTKLNQDFKTLLTALGAGDNKTTLSSFLQTLSQNLQGAPATGNLISTTA